MGSRCTRRANRCGAKTNLIFGGLGILLWDSGVGLALKKAVVDRRLRLGVKFR